MMWGWVKIPKGIALAAFFLPWVTVSCSQRKLISASGWQLASGRVSFLDESMEAHGSHPDLWIALALVAVIVGLVLSFGPARRALSTLVTSVAALLFIWIGTHNMTGQSIAARAAEERHESLDTAVASVIHVEWQWGYWLTTIALIVAAVLAWMAMTGRRVSLGSDRQ
jgi:hypothetical protein